MSDARPYFEAKLKAWADAQNPPIPIAYMGVGFNPDGINTYLETYDIPGATLNPSIDAVRVRNLGIFQINIITLDGQGMKQVEDIAKALVALFPVIPKVSNVSVECTPSIFKSIPDGNGRRITPVSINYRIES